MGTRARNTSNGSAPVADAPAQADVDAVAQAAVEASAPEPAPAPEPTPEPTLTPAQARKARAAAQAAKQVKAAKFVPDEGLDWVEIPGFGRAAVCLSAPNGAGESYFYVVQQNRGKDVAIPLFVIEKLQAAGQI